MCIDLFCGLGGWAEGFLAEGYRVIGFDIERHDYGTGGYPGQLVLQDALTLHGSQFRDAACIVASPPCQEYSYMAMPWSRAKKIAAEYRDGTRDVADLTRLFDACFRIQREAIAATVRNCPACGGKGFMVWYVNETHPCERCDGQGYVTHHIPLVVENVKGAQPWVGKAAWHYGSFYLWGDVPALMPFTMKTRKSQHEPLCENSKHEGRFYGQESKNNGGSWFNVAHNTESGVGQNPVHDGVKCGGSAGDDWFAHHNRDSFGIKQKGSGAAWFDKALDERRRDATKCGGAWFGKGNDMSLMRQHNSKSDSRKAASAQIAKIPFPLANHIARVFKP